MWKMGRRRHFKVWVVDRYKTVSEFARFSPKNDLKNSKSLQTRKVTVVADRNKTLASEYPYYEGQFYFERSLLNFRNLLLHNVYDFFEELYCHKSVIYLYRQNYKNDKSMITGRRKGGGRIEIFHNWATRSEVHMCAGCTMFLLISMIIHKLSFINNMNMLAGVKKQQRVR
jgi:hypothetical protein